MKTYSPKPRDIERRWYVLDASGAILGRLATQAATILRGKHKPIFAPHADTGDHVIVINAKDVTLSGGKENKKIAYHHSGYPGGLTETVYSRLLARRPAFAVEKAAPKTRPEPKAPAAKPSTAKRTTSTSPARKTSGKTTAKRSTAKTPAKRTTAKATTAKGSTAKSTAKKTTAKKTTAKRTTKKET